MLDRINTSAATAFRAISVKRYGERNARIMRERVIQHEASQRLMLAVNARWYERAWQTPDVAVALGRFDRFV